MRQARITTPCSYNSNKLSFSQNISISLVLTKTIIFPNLTIQVVFWDLKLKLYISADQDLKETQNLK